MTRTLPLRLGVFLLLLIAVLGGTIHLASAAEAIDIGNRRELFVDRLLVDTLEGARLKLHHPQPMGVALRFDKPWEGAFCGYVTVLRDGEMFRMYYRGLPTAGKDGSAAEVTCYAESRDGIHWTKPALGLFEIDGSRENNVVLANAAPVTHNFCPFIDSRPDIAPDERYKALGGTAHSGLIAYVSADGIRWRKLQDEPVFRDSGWVFDSQNVPFWSEAEGCYVLYYRRSPGGVRSVARTTSTDFRHWTKPVEMSFGDTPREHLYTNQTHPYYRAPHIYVGVAARFMPGRRVLSKEQAEAIRVDPKYFGDISDCVLLTTRGGARYERTFLEAFIRPGLGWENWVSRTNYPALGVLPTGKAEMSIYVQKNYGQPTARLDRYALRPDGFISVNAPYAGGEMRTPPLTFSAPANSQQPVELHINYATSAPGFVRVEIQDADGRPLPGFSLAESTEIIGDELDRVVSWDSGSDLRSLAGRPIRLRFVMKDADLYAIQFR